MTHRTINTTWLGCGNSAAAFQSLSCFGYKASILPHITCDVIRERKNSSQRGGRVVFTGSTSDRVVSVPQAENISVFVVNAHHCEWYRAQKIHSVGPKQSLLMCPRVLQCTGTPLQRSRAITLCVCVVQIPHQKSAERTINLSGNTAALHLGDVGLIAAIITWYVQKKAVSINPTKHCYLPPGEV